MSDLLDVDMTTGARLTTTPAALWLRRDGDGSGREPRALPPVARGGRWRLNAGEGRIRGLVRARGGACAELERALAASPYTGYAPRWRRNLELGAGRWAEALTHLQAARARRCRGMDGSTSVSALRATRCAPGALTSARRHGARVSRKGRASDRGFAMSNLEEPKNRLAGAPRTSRTSFDPPTRERALLLPAASRR